MELPRHRVNHGQKKAIIPSGKLLREKTHEKQMANQEKAQRKVQRRIQRNDRINLKKVATECVPGLDAALAQLDVDDDSEDDGPCASCGEIFIVCSH